MKTLQTLLFSMLFSISIFSQDIAVPEPILGQQQLARGLKVINKSQCTQHFVVLGYKPCKCYDGNHQAFQSELKSIAPNSEEYYNHLNLGGLFNNNYGEEKWIALVRIAGNTDETSCFFGGTIGQTCFPPYKIKYITNDANSNCEPCPAENIYTIAEWISAQNCDQDAILLFTNP